MTDQSINWEVSEKDGKLIDRILDRAISNGHLQRSSRLSSEMDIIACHMNGTPLLLEAWLEGPTQDFTHDLYGIKLHMDRKTGKLAPNFEPRFSATKSKKDRKRQRGAVDPILLLINVGIIACVALCAAMVGLAIDDGKKWEAFKVKHECKKVAHISGDVFNTVGFGANGQVSIGIGSTPDKTGWACNDGMTYYR